MTDVIETKLYNFDRHVTRHARVLVRQAEYDTVKLVKCHWDDVESTCMDARKPNVQRLATRALKLRRHGVPRGSAYRAEVLIEV